MVDQLSYQEFGKSGSGPATCLASLANLEVKSMEFSHIIAFSCLST